MSAFVAFTSFSLFWLALTLFGLPWARRVVASFSKDDHPSGFATVALAPALGITFFLLVFSLLGRVIPSYAPTLVATFLVLGAFVYVLRRFLPRTDQPLTVRDFSPLLFLVVFQFAMWLPRLWFSDIHYDSGMYGAEKLFNLSLQQSFTYGSGYPPQSTWLVGEPEVYYILPRLLPGLATHFAVNFAGVGIESAGVFFHLSDTFYNACASLTLAGAAEVFFSRLNWSAGKRVVMALLMGVLPFLAAPARIFHQVYNSAIDFWSLTRIVPFTINEYPFWNYVFADNHAHNNAAYLDVLITFLLLITLARGVALSGRMQGFIGVVLGAVATTLYMSQPASALIVVVVFTLPLIGMAVVHRRRGDLWKYLVPFQWALLTAVLTGCVDLLTRPQAQLKWNVFPSRLATSVPHFFNIHFTFLALLLLLLFWLIDFKKLKLKPAAVKGLLALGVLSGVGFAMGYPVLGLAPLILALALLPIMHFESSDRQIAGITLLGFVMMIVFPELAGADFDMGPDYIRLNTVFKFHYTSFFTLPLGFAFAYSTQAMPVERGLLRKYMVVFLSVLLLLSLLTVQFFTLKNRFLYPGSRGGLSGYEFLKIQRPEDAQIIRFLSSLDEPVILAEECGVPPKPGAYTVAGRIAAYSGRPSLCGWGMHTLLRNSVFHGDARRGQEVWPYLQAMDKALSSLFIINSSSPEEQRKNALQAVEKIRTEGATHLIFGELERANYPQGELAAVEALVKGRVVFRAGASAVIALRGEL